MRPTNFLQEYRYFFYIFVFFFLSRIALAYQGIAYDSSSIGWFWQYLDIELLRNNLAESLFYLHSQPPLFNLFLGLTLKLFPVSYEIVFQCIYLGMSFVIYALLFVILKAYGLKQLLAFCLATIFIISPEAILYENWLFYTWPIVFFLVASVFFLQKYQITRNPQYALIFFLIITIIAFTRSTFHLIYIFIPIAIVFLIVKKNRKIIAMYSLAPILLILLLYGKNFILFDSFGASSWIGMNIWKIAARSNANVATSKLSSASTIGAFAYMDAYPAKYHALPGKYEKIKALNNKYKENSHINMNHYGYIKISNDLKKDSIRIVKNNFPNYLLQVVTALKIYSKPSWKYPFLANNFKKIKKYAYSISFLRPNHTQILIPIALFIISLYILINIATVHRHKKIDYVSFFLFYNIMYVTIIGNAFEIGENNRFRVMIDPLLYLLLIVSIRGLYRTIIPAGRTYPKLPPADSQNQK